MSLLAGLCTGAFAVGLLGGVHCLGMCGGIAASLGGAGASHPAWAVRLGYNAGRVGSYAVAGALAGGLGGAGLLLGRILPVQLAFYVVANLLLVGLGLYLAGWTGLLSRLEGPGQRLWRRLQPLAARLLPARSVAQGVALGAVWGWIPCGLVYSVLGTALLTGSAAGGAAVMLAFGAGTLPNLLAAGWMLGLARAAGLGEAMRGGLACLS